ncbi:DUF3826 domain-containing protein [Bythopirellula goksoeyrii]|uniref:DUF3826 domain-containing protein n=1 Tax=Bythopirellula goksoeyrii TaxID=1400387 RepID=A0A5B9QCT8_9BACT|nr:DUF3826 domain-containing protein [Bythopirellula goksoeyrii]QEG36778.1 hypothetical protein Pr1d_41140 [Bythopirellula goksoeyrii]
MHNLVLSVVSLLAVSLSLSSAVAETAAVVAARTQAAIDKGNAPTWWAPKLPEEIQRDVEGKGKQLADRLDLKHESKTQETAALVSQHFARVWAWHQEVDKELDAAWDAWDAARGGGGGQKDELKALTIMTEQIDPIYAQFTPQIQGLLIALKEQIGEEKTTRLLDIITRSPGAERTFNAYVGMVPEMTDEEKEILWNRMAQAREDSLAAWTDGRIIKIFKKYKIRNEFSIDYFGYDYRKRYTEWAKGQR